MAKAPPTSPGPPAALEASLKGWREEWGGEEVRSGVRVEGRKVKNREERR